MSGAGKALTSPRVRGEGEGGRAGYDGFVALTLKLYVDCKTYG
jgi:hypothetical protein